MLLNQPESTDVESFLDTIYVLQDLAECERITQVFGGHGQTPNGIEVLEIYEEIATEF